MRRPALRWPITVGRKATILAKPASRRTNPVLVPPWTRADVAILAGFPAAAFTLFAALHARVLNAPGELDTWIYTAVFENWDYMYRVFGDTYYVSRMPYLIPGYLVHQLFSPVASFYVVHWGYLFMGALAVFLLFRRFYNRTIAALGYAAMLTNVLFYDTHVNDYYDGAVIAYLLLGLFFVVTSPASRTPALRMATGGFFLCGAATTNLFAGIPVACMLVIYAAVRWPDLRYRPVRLLGQDTALVAAGAVVMLVACGLFSFASGGELFYLGNQLDVLGTLDLSPYKAQGYGFLAHEPKFLVPIFLLVVFGVLWRRRFLSAWSTDPAVRLAAGSAAYLALLFGVVTVWEFAFGGIFYEITYYFSYVLTGFILCLGGTLWAMFQHGVRPIRANARQLIIIAAAVAAALPAFLITRPSDFFSSGHGTAVAVVLMMVALAAVVVLRLAPRLAWTRAAAVLLVVLGVNFASAAGVSGYGNFQTSPATRAENRALLALGVDLVQFLNGTAIGSQAEPPAFWFNGKGRPWIDSLQSMYLWQTTWIGRQMPAFGPGERAFLESQRPPSIALICVRPSCGGGATSLRRAGYQPQQLASTSLARAPFRIWVRVYRLPKFFVRDAADAFYRPAASDFAMRPRGHRIWSESFSDGLPAGWSGSASVISRDPTRVATRSTPYEYSVISNHRWLPPGRYRVYLSGKVIDGGLDLGVLDAGADKWIVQSFYWFRQDGFGRGLMSAAFELKSRTRIRVVLSNWVPKARKSRWELRELQIVRIS